MWLKSLDIYFVSVCVAFPFIFDNLSLINVYHFSCEYNYWIVIMVCS